MAGKNGNKKHGRNKADCTRYTNENRHEKSHARRLTKHLLVFPGDAVAKLAYAALPPFVQKARPLVLS